MPELRLVGGRALRRRESRHPVNPLRPYAHFVEPERTADGDVEDVATIFLTNKECPFRCVFCDLWRNTTEQRVPRGAVAGQVEWALRQMPWAPHVKLYNSGNFFDEQATPRHDRPRIARLLADRRTVIVECHPKLVDRRCLDFATALTPRLEVAMGLETVDPRVLPRLNKGMTLEDFERATSYLVSNGIRVRAFILLPAPYQNVEEGVHWAGKSIEFAFSVGVECCAVIPLRTEDDSPASAQPGRVAVAPTLRAMERTIEHGLSLRLGRVFLDLWDLDRFAPCNVCRLSREARLREINFSQSVPPRIPCDCKT